MRSSARRPILPDSIVGVRRLRCARDFLYSRVIINIYKNKDMIRELLR
jgi:hypothetical protein